MPKELVQYQKDVNNLIKFAKTLNLSDNQITEVLQSSFNILEEKHESSNCYNSAKAQTFIYTITKIFVFIILVISFVYVLLNVHQPTSSIVLRNVQGLIYPGLKALRFLSVPIIKKFPSLTNLYDESCLLENSFFYVPEMECWPCENVHSVINLTGFNNHSLYQSGTPYVIKTNQKLVSFETLREVYSNHKDLLDEESNNIKATNSNIQNLADLFESTSNAFSSSNSHVVWRINKMSAGRIIRTLFPRPYVISEWSGQSIERYVMIDAKATTYTLPSTECSYVSVVQSFGTRTIILKPSQECSYNCKTISIVLSPTNILWYNWWYWRPISLPTQNSTDISVTYITSYC